MSDETLPGGKNETPEQPTDATQSASGEASAGGAAAPLGAAVASGGTAAAGAPPDPDSELVEPDDALPEVRLDDLSERMRNAARDAGWSSLMPVQAKTIPYILAKRDLMIQSQTGSGKTGAFVLPLLERIDTSLAACQALILIPTRELALQVQREAELLAGASGVRTVAVYGGVAYGPQLDAFRLGAHIVVGTPGRVLDHLLKRSLTLESLRMLVFDEADRMLSMGFYPDMKQVQRYLPKSGVNGYMFSATYPVYVMRLAAQFLTKPEFLSLSSDHVHAAGTTHVYYEVPQMDKDRCLVRIIEIENPTSAIVFCNTRQQVHYVTTILQRFGYDADELSSDLGQAPREKVLARVRQRTLRFLVATDVAARGIDIQDLSHVFLYDVPEDPESYVHRAGRTGRAGATGEAVSLVAGIEPIELQRIAKRFNITMERRPAPTEEDVATVVSQRLVALLEARLRTRDKMHVERMQRFLPLVRGLADSEDESALMAMLLDDVYQESLHAPTPEPGEEDVASAQAEARREVPGSEDRERYNSPRKAPRRRPGRSR
jgi:ATP-dependent RNA helicase DeaD